MTTDARKPRGFATMTPERRREIAAMGGKGGAGSPRKPWAIDAESARENGRKGGLNRWKNRLPSTD